MLPQGHIYSIIDPMLERNFNVNSAWKAVEIAMACVSAEASHEQCCDGTKRVFGSTTQSEKPQQL
ncbi:putative transferase [Rosa chinensis]|uniref:Putative transferase n=1 Tax=Rosa chinensis TaxID=74649 RepID=A0A2P6RXL1_ROSCH|nr:putative transferase [Rosa chinensis]